MVQDRWQGGDEEVGGEGKRLEKERYVVLLSGWYWYKRALHVVYVRTDARTHARTHMVYTPATKLRGCVGVHQQLVAALGNG